MKDPRDTQRQRLYDAEGKACADAGVTHWGQTIKNDDLQGYVNSVLAHRAVASRWPNKKIRVELGKGGGSADRYGEVITLGTQARSEAIILHEIAHCLVPVWKGNVAPHGPEFAGVLLWLYQTVHSKALGDALRQAYKDGRVRKSNAMIPKPIDKTERYLLDRIASLTRQRQETEMAIKEARRHLEQHRATKAEKP